MLLERERTRLIEYCLRMEADELTVGTSGNLSERAGELIAITPSGVAYQDLTPASICVLNLAGDQLDGALAPSTELPMHTSVYQHTDARAVVHTHPLYATALSVVLDEVPPVHYLIGLLGGPVRVAPYARYGTDELAAGALHALRGRSGVLMRNHGATTYGPSLDTAYTRSVYLEWVCRLYHQARQLGEPILLTDGQLAEATAQLATYGRHPR